jgi:hypothetical protein
MIVSERQTRPRLWPQPIVVGHAIDLIDAMADKAPEWALPLRLMRGTRFHIDHIDAVPLAPAAAAHGGPEWLERLFSLGAVRYTDGVCPRIRSSFAARASTTSRTSRSPSRAIGWS